ncbi:hypothetical protein [Lysobacter enzymogenes]|uniref:Uncharacterized protein n=1 Tax=Lysobacter enzymogenes TaxID=69 RepID=A0A3N2RLZ2_LYSEN|nr:hypothetical protein [Lysobacter enzymogenes]ROU08356.1 hypothetical protein D9T17_04600 [Lysobacter enzymogenes]
MTFDNWLPAILSQAAFMTPSLLAYITGIVLCLSWRRRIGVGATYAVAAFALLVFGQALSLLGQVWIYRAMADGISASSTSLGHSVIGVAHVLISLVSTGLLIAAVLAKRPPSPA